MVSINASIIDQQVRQIVADNKPALVELARGDEQKHRSAAFVLLCVKTLLDLGDDEAMECLTDGGHDAAIDAMHMGDIIEGEFRITLFQAKYKQRLDGESAFPATGIGKIAGTIRTLFDPDKPFHSHPQLTARVEEIRSLIRDGYLPHVRVVLCNNGKRWNADGQAAIDGAGFPPDRVTWEHLDPDRLIELMQSQSAVDAELKLAGAYLVEDFNFRRVLVGKIPINELASLFERHGDRLLERNIRRYLGVSENRVNRDIGRTLRAADERPNFYFFNNGVTVVCTKFRHNALQEKNPVVRVEKMQVINGGQTCHTIRRVVKNNPDADFSQACVLLRLYELDDGERDLVRDITYATNSQNPVDLRDLRANDPVQQRLEMGMRDLGVTYLRKRGAPQRNGKTIEPSMAAEAVLAIWRRKPHLARFDKNQHFGRFYEQIFSQDLSPAQVIIAVEILRKVEQKRKHAGSDAPRFVPYASHFLAMLVGDALLERMGISLDKLTHQNIDTVRAQLQSFDELYENAVLKLCILLCLERINDEKSSLQKLSATFRRGDLLAALADLKTKAQAEAALLTQRHLEYLQHMAPIRIAIAQDKSKYDENFLQIVAQLDDNPPDFIDWVTKVFGNPPSSKDE